MYDFHDVMIYMIKDKDSDKVCTYTWYDYDGETFIKKDTTYM